MDKLRSHILGLALLLAAGLARAQTATVVGPGWAKSNVNGAVLRKNSVLSLGAN